MLLLKQAPFMQLQFIEQVLLLLILLLMAEPLSVCLLDPLRKFLHLNLLTIFLLQASLVL
jgi:hypothetical protein